MRSEAFRMNVEAKLDEQRSPRPGSRVRLFRPTSLRTRMALYFGALFALILLLVSMVRTFGLPWTSDRGSYGLQQAQVLKQVALLADLEKERLRLWLDERRHDAAGLAESPVVASSVSRLVKLVEEDAVRQGSPLQPTEDLLSNESAGELTAVLNALKTSHGIYSKISIVDAKNKLIIASTDRKDLGLELSEPKLSSLVMNPRKGASVIVRESPETGRAEAVISQTIPDRSHGDSGAASDLRAAVMLYVDGERLLKPLLYGAGKIGESEEIVLVDQDLRLILPLRFPLTSGKRPRPFEYVVETEPATFAVQGKEGVSIGRDYRGVVVLAAYRHIQVARNASWGLVVKVDEAEILGPTWRRLSYATVVSLLGVLAASIVAALLAGRIARPIRNLSLTAREVEAGNLNARAAATGSDEVGDLAVTFNSMIGRVQHWQRDLEEQVEIRTRRLIELNEELTTEISDRKQAEREKELLIGELETKNAELERFTYTVSHDLSSPLITIKTFAGFIEEALKEGKTDDVESDLGRIKRAAGTMEQLLEELLELSRIGRVVNPSTRVPMTEVAREALELLGGTIAERRVDVEITSNMPAVHGDRPRLLEVFQNLVENALKFTRDQPHPKVEIGTGEADGALAFYVRDNGQGIDRTCQERVFRLFDKLDQDSEGTGIGLAIVKRIVEVHGGRVWVESQGSGCGSTFWFTLTGSGRDDAEGDCENEG